MFQSGTGAKAVVPCIKVTGNIHFTPTLQELRWTRWAAAGSGIYRCMGCGREVASNESEPLPPQNHHQHNQNQGSIRWKLIVYADHREK
jgi:hypothetical protein